MENLYDLLTFAAIAMVCGGILIWSFRNQSDIAKSVSEYGLHFDSASAWTAEQFVARTRFARELPKGNALNSKIVEFDGNKLLHIDYEWYTKYSYGNRRRAERQSMALLLPARNNFPSFELYPEGVLRKLDSLIGGQDIDFNDHPAFSSKYVLQSDHEKFIRTFFDNEILNLFAENPGWWIQSRRNGMMIYKKGRYCSGKDAVNAIELALQILPLFEEQGSRLLQHELSEVEGLSCMQWLPSAMPGNEMSYDSV